MEGHLTAVDDQSHYEISLTAGQAFVAFVLLLLSLAAAFAFGLVIGKGQADDRLVVRRDQPVVTEASLLPKKDAGRIVELGVAADDFEDGDANAAPPAEAAPVETALADAAVPAELVTPARVEPAPTATPTPAQPEPRSAVTVDAPKPAEARVPHIAQLLSTTDQKTAEALAVRLIENGFNTAYVERGSNEKGAIFRVRVRFDSESAARAAEAKLRAYSSEVWITAR